MLVATRARRGAAVELADVEAIRFVKIYFLYFLFLNWFTFSFKYIFYIHKFSIGVRVYLRSQRECLRSEVPKKYFWTM